MKGVKQGAIINWGYFMKYFLKPFAVNAILVALNRNEIKQGARYANNLYSGRIKGSIVA